MHAGRSTSNASLFEGVIQALELLHSFFYFFDKKLESWMELLSIESAADVIIKWLKSFFNVLKFFIINELGIKFEKFEVKRSCLLSIVDI